MAGVTPAMHPTPQRTALIALVLLVLAAGCSSKADVGVLDPTGVAEPASSDDAPESDREGWVGGEPSWNGGPGAEVLSGEDVLEEAAVAMDEAASTSASGAAAAPAPDLPSVEVDDIALEPSQQAAPLRAGSVDDNADFGGFLAYLDRIADLGITVRPYDPAGRVVVNVTGSSGLPVQGEPVAFALGQNDVATLRTTADGSVRFHPANYDAGQSTSFEVTVAGTTTTVSPGETLDLTVDRPGGAQGSVPVDVLFLLDATGSMSDEIDRLKTSIDSIAARLDALDSQPDLRYGMTLYRDQGDAFVTANFDFTDDVATFRSALRDVVADGGGDTPEALDEALADALTVPSWRDPSSTVQLVFLVADAPPQVNRQVPQPYTASLLDAAARGIKVFPVASSDTDDQAEAVFRQLAQGTGGRFVFLTYGAGGAATGSSTDIDRPDYEELALDDLIVRLVTEELAALTGDTPPPVQVVQPTNPPGQ